MTCVMAAIPIFKEKKDEERTAGWTSTTNYIDLHAA